VDWPPVIKHTVEQPAAVGSGEPPACAVAIALHKAALDEWVSIKMEVGPK